MGQYDVQTVGDGYPVPYPVYKVTALANCVTGAIVLFFFVDQ